jgi:hypothetical protein
MRRRETFVLEAQKILERCGALPWRTDRHGREEIFRRIQNIAVRN